MGGCRMKTTLLGFLLFLPFQIQALPLCSYEQSFKADGWIVHSSDQFHQMEIELNKRLELGLNNHSLVYDMSGSVWTRDTVDHQEIELHVTVFDDLNTSRDLMYGDLAIVENAENNNQRVELRWFDGKKRHIIFNKEILTCFADGPPIVENSVF